MQFRLGRVEKKETLFFDGSGQRSVLDGVGLLLFLIDVVLIEVSVSKLFFISGVHFFPLLDDLADDFRLAEFWKHTGILVVALPGELAIYFA